MRYIGPLKCATTPKFHVSKEGLPLCGADLEMRDFYLRDGLPNLYALCKDCQQRQVQQNGRYKEGRWSIGERARININLCKEFKREAEQQ